MLLTELTKLTVSKEHNTLETLVKILESTQPTKEVHQELQAMVKEILHRTIFKIHKEEEWAQVIKILVMGH